MKGPTSRVLVVSHRHVHPLVSWASGYEFEDVVCDIDDAHLVSYQPVHRLVSGWEEKTLGRLHRYFGIGVTRQQRLQPTRLTQDYELLFAHVGGVQDLAMLEAVEGWRSRCRIKVCWIEELWSHRLGHTKLLDGLRQFDHVFVGHATTAPALAKRIDRPCSFLAPAVDALRFCPYPDPPERSIDVFALGRRLPAVHDSLLKRSMDDAGFYYHYDSARWTTFVEDHVQHRHLIASHAKRSRYFLADRAKVDQPEWTQGSQVFGPRFFEGAAAGAVLIGDPPDCDSFRAHFDWPDAVIQRPPGPRGICDLIDTLDADPARVNRARRANILNVLKRHDWLHRWQSVLATVGMAPRDAALARATALQRRADEVVAAMSAGAAGDGPSGGPHGLAIVGAREPERRLA